MPMIDQVLARMGQLHPKVIDLSLDRVLALMDRLGRPQDRLPPVIHVAGTNGKGSTIATMRAVAEAAGLTVHVYTSPHLVRFAERIRVAGHLLSDLDLLALLERVEAANDGQPITFFEITTAAAFLAFAETPADLVLLETGLGGRLDATNLVTRPTATVITPIGLDHQQFLGDGREAIAGEKAGIIKSGCPLVLAAQPDPVRTVILDRAQALNAAVWLEGRDFSAHATGPGTMRLSMKHEVLDLPRPALAGDFQVGNAARALCALRLALPWLDGEVMARGLGRVSWPARLQRLTQGPLIQALPANWELWLDGGHNPHAAQALAPHLAGWKDLPLYGLMGMLSTKDVAGYLAPLAPYLDHLAAIAIPDEAASLSAQQSAQAATGQGIAASAHDDLPLAFAHLCGKPGPARILIAGSLYLAGHVLAENG